MTFNPVAYDSTLKPSVALLAEHQLQLRDTYLVFTTTRPTSHCLSLLGIVLSVLRKVPPSTLFIQAAPLEYIGLSLRTVTLLHND